MNFIKLPFKVRGTYDRCISRGHSKVGLLELEQGISWESFVPLICLYEPYLDFSEVDKCLNSLYHPLIDIMLNSLENTVWQMVHMQF